MDKTISIFCDFDATISVIDVGDDLFKTYGNWYELYIGFSSDMYDFDVIELNKRLCNSLKSDLSFEEIYLFAIDHELDTYFVKFIDFCVNNKINFMIVSDGYDAYINPILHHHQLDFLPVYCNLLIKRNNIFEPSFFGAVEGCLCPTASCKRNVVINNSADEDIVIYIGDGHTDYCGAEHSDIVFAKSRLAAYCNEKRIPHYPFKTFFDIYRILDSKIKNNDLHHRHQAKMKRKSAFEME
jgi:2,3-diketo-5-methylthio-1-phosphopentane phosphatase